MHQFSKILSARLPFFYGYVMVFIAVLAQICSSPGQTFAISAFIPFMQESLGLSASQISAAFMLGTFFAAFPLSVIGPLADRFGLKWTTVGVAVALSLACLVISAATGFLSLLVGFLLLRFLGQGALTLLGSNLISMWFREHLGTVNSVMSAGGAAAFAIVPLMLLSSIESFGWRATYIGLGFFVFLALVPTVLLLLSNRPEELGQWPDGIRLKHAIDSAVAGVDEIAVRFHFEPELTLKAAASQRTFWILAADMALWAMIGTGIVFHALPIFEGQGIAPERSQLLFATFSASMLLSQIAGGIMSDRLPMHRLLAAGYGLLLAGTIVIPLTTQESHVHLFAALFGAGQGLAISVNSAMWVRYYGRKHLGKIRGTVWCSTVAGSGCGPFILGLFYDQLGSFQIGLWVFAGLLIPLIPLSLFATPPTEQADSPAGTMSTIPSSSASLAVSLQAQPSDGLHGRDIRHKETLISTGEAHSD